MDAINGFKRDMLSWETENSRVPVPRVAECFMVVSACGYSEFLP